jgi:hypothetical protein
MFRLRRNVSIHAGLVVRVHVSVEPGATPLRVEGGLGMLSLTGIVLGLINVAIYVAILVLIGLVIVWFASWLNFPIPQNIQRVYMVIVALIALYLILALLFGLPMPGPIRLVGRHHAMVM